MWLINCRIWWHRLGLRTWVTFNGSDWSIAEYDDRGGISEPESFTFNGNSNWTGFSFFGLYLLNDNLVLYFLILVIDYMRGWLILFDECFWKTWGNDSLFWVFWEFNSTFFTFFPPFLFNLRLFFQSKFFPSMKNNGNIMVLLKGRGP